MPITPLNFVKNVITDDHTFAAVPQSAKSFATWAAPQRILGSLFSDAGHGRWKKSSHTCCSTALAFITVYIVAAGQRTETDSQRQERRFLLGEGTSGCSS